MHLIHYGSSKYDPKLFQPISNREGWIKPHGGLWTSPYDSIESWAQWCRGEDYHVDDLAESFEVKLVSKEVLTINTVEDMDKMSWMRGPHGLWWIDFETLAGFYDAIHLTAEGQWETRNTHPRHLYGWDCECVLILNKEAIKEM